MDVLGLPSLRKKLKRLPELAREEIRKAMEAGAAEMVALAKSLVPRDSGDLANSIGWTWGDAPKGSMALGEVRGGAGAGNLRITIYAGSSEVFWARWVEFGTSPHANAGQFEGSEHPGTAAQPFFFVSFRALRRRIKGRVSRAITKSAKRAASGG
jgi:hypothetical protein